MSSKQQAVPASSLPIEVHTEGGDNVESEASEASWSSESSSDGSDLRELEDRKKQLEAEDKYDRRGSPDKELFIDSFGFCAWVGVTSMVNVVVLALETDFRCTRICNQPQTLWDVSGQLLTALFVIEILVRIAVAKPRRYFQGQKERRSVKYQLDWLNVFDFTIVFLRCVDQWIFFPAGTDTGLRKVSAFRILQVGQFVKQLQLNRSFRELWLVVSSFGEVIKTLAWVLVMMILVIWVCAVLLTMSLLDTPPEEFNVSASSWSFKDYWETVLKTSGSLFQVVTRDKWADSLVWPIVSRFPALMLLFVIFLAIAGMSLMNSITAVVVECTLATSRRNAEKETKEKDKLDQKVMASLKKIFMETPVECSGQLSQMELAEFLCKHRVRDRLKWLVIPLRDLETLFHLLDEDGTGFCNRDMFFRGVQRIRGQATASDLHQMSVDLNRNLEWIQGAHDMVKDTNGMLSRMLDHASEVDTEVVLSDTDFRDPVLKTRRLRPKYSAVDRLNVRDASGAGIKALMPKSQDAAWDEFGGTYKKVVKKRMSAKEEKQAIGGVLYALEAQKKAESQRDSEERAAEQKREEEHEEKVRQAKKLGLPPPPKPSTEGKRDSHHHHHHRKSRHSVKQVEVTKQPDPPPMPEHINRLKEQQVKAKAEAIKAKAKARRAAKLPYSQRFN